MSRGPGNFPFPPLSTGLHMTWKVASQTNRSYMCGPSNNFCYLGHTKNRDDDNDDNDDETRNAHGETKMLKVSQALYWVDGSSNSSSRGNRRRGAESP